MNELVGTGGKKSNQNRGPRKKGDDKKALNKGTLSLLAGEEKEDLA
jgi:hypothetical protein